MNRQKILNKKRERRKNRVRAKILGLPSKPRLSIFRSNKYIYVQLIDDTVGRTLVSASSQKLDNSESKKTKVEKAAAVGRIIAKKALEAGIREAVLDRGAYRYHGQIKALAEAAREVGLKI